MTDPDVLISVGKIIGTHGIRGLLKIHSFSGNIESLQSSGAVTLKSPSGDLSEYEIESVSQHCGKFILSLTGFDEINQVLPFVGREICLLRSHFPEPEEDEYYWIDLIGLKVMTDDGVILGNISDIFEAGSSDIYVVRGDNKEYLIPAIADVIVNIDLKAGIVLIKPLQGLLDL